MQFDGREQMPRLGRFLLGGWLRTERLLPLRQQAEVVGGGAAYRNDAGARHQREVELFDGVLRVKDSLEGFSSSAILRWRLAPGDWALEQGADDTSGSRWQVGNSLGQVLEVSGSVPIVRCELVSGWESRHYLEKTPVPVLEVEIDQSGIMTTELCWVA